MLIRIVGLPVRKIPSRQMITSKTGQSVLTCCSSGKLAKKEVFYQELA